MGRPTNSSNRTTIMNYKLNLDTWVTGTGTSLVGRGSSTLLNPQGYMCCLGQFAEQSGVPRHKLAGAGCPADLAPYEKAKIAWTVSPRSPHVSSRVAQRLISLNDAEYKLRESIKSRAEKIKAYVEENTDHTVEIIGTDVIPIPKVIPNNQEEN